VTSTGGWLDLTNRKLIVPPEALLAAMRSLAQTEDFQVLASSVK
jgi:acyl-CoA thioester hydrolase